MNTVDFEELERRIMSRFGQPNDGISAIKQETMKISALMAIQVLKEYEKMKQEIK